MLTLKRDFWLLFLSFVIVNTFFPNIFVEEKRMIVACFAIYFIGCLLNKNKWVFSKFDISTYFFFGFWLAWACASYAWKQTDFLGFDKIYLPFLMCSFIIFFVVTQSFRLREKSLAGLFVVIFFLYLMMAIWEMVTWKHFSTTLATEANLLTPIPYGPFHNMNDLAAALLVLVPIALFFSLNMKSFFSKFLINIAVLLSVAIAALQGARLAMLFYFFFLFVFIIFFTKPKYKLSLVIFMFSLLVIITTWYPKFSQLFYKYAKQQVTSIGTESETSRLTSVKIRKLLLYHAFDIGYSYGFMGAGAGSFPAEMGRGRAEEVGGIMFPHNFFMDIFATLGIFVFLGIVTFYLVWLYQLFSLARSEQNPQEKNCYWGAFFSALAFFVSSTLVSYAPRYEFYWIMFAYYYLLINKKEYQKNSLHSWNELTINKDTLPA